MLTCVLSNDATAIAFTPIVYRTVANVGLDVRPFLFGVTFVADTASFGLPFSIRGERARIAAPRLHGVRLAPRPAATCGDRNQPRDFSCRLSPVVTRAVRRKAPRMPAPAAVRVAVVLGCLVVSYALALVRGWPLGPVAAFGAIAALAVAGIRERPAGARVQWGTFVLLAGLFVIFAALARAGIADWATRELTLAAGYGRLAAVAAAAGGAALLSNALNNLPVAVAASLVNAHPQAQAFAYPLIAGIDLGPNLTLAGSLATILWASVLRQHDVRVNALEYARLGALTVPPMLAAVVLWLWVVG